ncbi:glutamate--cysteine ligase 2 [Nocardia brevicatena]|uniref:glutamate--cysteine ligase 2 n=1 Tax=Nocardia brevicatena TaxID=37327 RepID=UPI000592A88B|nr:glutamate--cysteine ligase [Nocardia brevicatena]
MDAAELTVGVEEEFLLVDPVTGVPVAKNVDVAHTAEQAGVDLQLELSGCQVETSTGIHTESATLLEEVYRLRRTAACCAAKNDARLLAVAIPPTVPTRLPITESPRYRRIADNFGILAQEPGLCGCHVHVGVPDRETAVQVGNYLRPWLPLLLALTANSSIYRGAETGYASWRSILWRRWPSAGPPPYFACVADYDAMVEMMLSSGSILDRAMVYWDVRPSASFPTVEVRVSDVPATVTETALLATMVRAIVMTARHSLERGDTAPELSAEILRAAYWRAARSGLDGDGLDPLSGRVAPMRALVSRLMDHIIPALEELGGKVFVTDGLAHLLAEGNGAHRQAAALRRRGRLGDVITALSELTTGR